MPNSRQPQYSGTHSHYTFNDLDPEKVKVAVVGFFESSGPVTFHDGPDVLKNTLWYQQQSHVGSSLTLTVTYDEDHGSGWTFRPENFELQLKLSWRKAGPNRTELSY